MSKQHTPTSAAHDVEAALHLLEGRWKLVILFHLFGSKVMRFSDLERAIPTISQKMLGQQLRRLEADGIVVRTVYPQIPPRVEYRLTEWGQTLCPALDAILMWADKRPQVTNDPTAVTTLSDAQDSLLLAAPEPTHFPAS
jgi:DNA-binding HxlR family transcriptional regulator